MAVIANIGSNNPTGLAAIPTPVKIAVVGGAIGLVVFIMRKQSSSGNGETQQLLPNTAIMLGSLQDDLLNLKGVTGTGFADLSGQLTGTQDNLSAQLDALTSQTQKGLTDLQANMATGQTSNTNTILGALKGQGDVIAALIGSNSAAQKAASQALATSLGSGLDAIVAQHNAELAGITVLQQQQGGIQTAITNALGSLGTPSAGALPTNYFEGKFFRFNNYGSVFYVNGGKVYRAANEGAFNWDWSKVLLLPSTAQDNYQKWVSSVSGTVYNVQNSGVPDIR